MKDIIDNQIYFKFISYLKANNYPILINGMTGNQAHFANFLLSNPEIREQLRMIGDLNKVFILIQEFLKANPESTLSI